MKVKVNNSYSEWFETKIGVRQGDPLSALLFSVVLDSVITNLEVRGNITARLKQICSYADDIIYFLQHMLTYGALLLAKGF